MDNVILEVVTLLEGEEDTSPPLTPQELVLAEALARGLSN